MDDPFAPTDDGRNIYMKLRDRFNLHNAFTTSEAMEVFPSSTIDTMEAELLRHLKEKLVARGHDDQTWMLLRP